MNARPEAPRQNVREGEEIVLSELVGIVLEDTPPEDEGRRETRVTVHEEAHEVFLGRWSAP